MWSQTQHRPLSYRASKLIIAIVIAGGAFVPIGIWATEQLNQVIPFTYSDSVNAKWYKDLVLSNNPDLLTHPVTVKTQGGTVRGVIDSVAIVWKGIPYATANRWQAPVDPKCWDDVRETTTFAAKYPQIDNAYGEGKEGPLTVDIYRPNNGDLNLPVMFYVHGDSCLRGSSTEMDARELAVKDNIIVVSVNYRLGLLGFINLPALKTGDAYIDSGNFALLDLHKALDWTINNIYAFGGDYKNITITGSGCAGHNVNAMMISPLFKGKFQRALTFNAGFVASDKTVAQNTAIDKIAILALQDNKKATIDEAKQWLATDSRDVKEWLYQLDAQRMAIIVGGFHLDKNAFSPLIKDGVVIPEEGFDTTNFNAVPTMFISDYNNFSLYASHHMHFLSPWKDTSLLLNRENMKLLDQFRFSKKYGSDLYRLFNTSKTAERLFTRTNQPVYTGVMQWGRNELFVGKRAAELLGAYEGLSMILLTGNESLQPSTHKQMIHGVGVNEMRHAMQQYIKNFMYTGNPNGADLSIWAAWEPTGPANFLFDADDKQAVLLQGFHHTTFKEIYDEMIADDSISKTEKDFLVANILSHLIFTEELDVVYK